MRNNKTHYITKMKKTLSISPELEKFLTENPDLSPSKMLQSKIIEIQENRKINYVEIAKLQHTNAFLHEKLRESGDEIDILEKKLGEAHDVIEQMERE